MNQQRFLTLLMVLLAFVVPPSLAQPPDEQVNIATTATRAFVTNYEDDGISIIDPDARRPVGYIKTGSHPHGVAIAPNGQRVYVSNEGDGTLSTIDPATNKVVATIKVGKKPHQIVVSPNTTAVMCLSRLMQRMPLPSSMQRTQKCSKKSRSAGRPIFSCAVRTGKPSMRPVSAI